MQIQASKIQRSENYFIFVGGYIIMSKILIVYVSMTGNTAKMASTIYEGARAAGAEVTCKTVGDTSVNELANYDVIAFGSPAMGAEVIEESEMELFFTESARLINNKKIALFGSYGWGDGEWLRTWEARCKESGAKFIASVKAHLEPDDDSLQECKNLGAKLT